ncbi:MAG: sugar transferase [Akkermansia sp.]|nr:sugar transferase [Akkermansia sp.]
MSKQGNFYRLRLYPLLDLVLAMVFAYYSPYVTNWVAPLFGWQQGHYFNILLASPFLAGAAIMAVPIILRQVGFYHKQNLQRPGTAFRQLLAFGTYYLCAMGVFTVATETAAYNSRILLTNLVGITLVIYLRYLVTRSINLRRPEKFRRQVILAGDEDVLAKSWEELPEHWRRSFNVVGRFTSPAGREQELQEMIEQHNVTALFVFGGMAAHHDFAPFIEQCEVQGIDVNLVMRNRLSSSLRVDLNEVGDTRMVVFSSTPEVSWGMIAKGVGDRVLALCALICLSPLWLVAAIGIKISDPAGPVFFRQRRSGLYGRVFRMWKFRSMYVDAEARLDEIKAKYGNEMNGPIFKLTNDPRIFKFGHFIRKTSIDELPQLLNVLAGDMSIVGPRPLPVYETEAFPKIEHRRRLSVKPGLTCFWQIEDRSDNGDFDNMVAKDLRYIDEWSLWLDFKLMLRTIPAVLFGKGAK